MFGFLAQRLRLPPLVGYRVAGVVVGPFSGIQRGRVARAQLSEIGVILLMFGVGLHFRWAICWPCGASRCPGRWNAMLALGRTDDEGDVAITTLRQSARTAAESR